MGMDAGHVCLYTGCGVWQLVCGVGGVSKRKSQWSQWCVIGGLWAVMKDTALWFACGVCAKNGYVWSMAVCMRQVGLGHHPAPGLRPVLGTLTFSGLKGNGRADTAPLKGLLWSLYSHLKPRPFCPVT